MKRFFSIALALMLLLSACGKDTQPETTAAPAETTVSAEGPEGILDGTQSETVNKLVRVTFYDEFGLEGWHQEYTYDEAGFCIEERELSSAGTINYIRVNTANGKGLLATSQVTESGSYVYSTEYSYDEKDRLVLQCTYDEDKTLTERTEYTYDDHGNYLTLKQYYMGELAVDYSFSYTYDASGNQLSRDEYMGGMLISHVEMVYDEEGRELSSTSSMAGGASQTRTESAWEGLTETRKYYGVGDTEPYLTSVMTYDTEGNLLMKEIVYEGGKASSTEYTYEPMEIKK